MSTVAPTTRSDAEPLVDVEDLRVSFPTSIGYRPVVRGVSLRIEKGERVAVVGESGSGKTMIAMTLLGIQPPQARVEGTVRVAGTDVVTAPESTLRRMRGGEISMVFQEPLTSLNPVRTIGGQLMESVRRHSDATKAQARVRVVEALTSVGVPAPEERLAAYPHQLSGGLRQRVMIALALVNRPRVVVADEPTTALDATIQAQILDVLRGGLSGAALILITHDLAVAAEVCDRVLVV
jgi:ABC-type dipeptide/oligopeptide/nickel transport system ATPase component